MHVDRFRIPHTPNITKREVELILAGYPPFHREAVVTKDGQTIPIPIEDARNVTRGVSIVAVGLTMTSPLVDHNMETMERQHQRLRQGTEDNQYVHSFCPLRRALQNIKDAFPSKECVNPAFILIEKLFGPYSAVSQQLQILRHDSALQALFRREVCQVDVSLGVDASDGNFRQTRATRSRRHSISSIRRASQGRSCKLL